MTFLFDPPAKQKAPSLLLPPQRSDAAIAAEEDSARAAAAAARGRQATLLVSPADKTPTPTTKTLLGPAA